VESHDGSLSDRASRTPAPLSQWARTVLAARAVCDAAVRPDSCVERFAIPSWWSRDLSLTGAVRRDTRVSTEHTAGVEADGFHGGGGQIARDPDSGSFTGRRARQSLERDSAVRERLGHVIVAAGSGLMGQNAIVRACRALPHLT
jgi:hypothetical protein